MQMLAYYTNDFSPCLSNLSGFTGRFIEKHNGTFFSKSLKYEQKDCTA